MGAGKIYQGLMQDPGDVDANGEPIGRGVRPVANRRWMSGRTYVGTPMPRLTKSFVPGAASAQEAHEYIVNKARAETAGGKLDADLVYDVDQWTRHVFKRELGRSPALVEATNPWIDGDQPEQWPPFVRELFGRLYGLSSDARKGEVESSAKWAEEMHDMAEALPVWKGACERTAGNPWLAGEGATAAAGQLAAHLRNEGQAPPPDADARGREREWLERVLEHAQKSGAPLKDRQGMEQALKKAEAREKRAEQQVNDWANYMADPNAQRRMRMAMAAAASAAESRVDELQSLVGGLMGGSASGIDTAVLSPEEVKALQSPDVKRIAELAGRMRASVRRLAGEARMVRGGAPAETVGVTVGRDWERLLPSELGALSNPVTAAHLYSRILEGAALSYEVRTVDRARRGPIVFVCDESGSMLGQKNVWAKAFALGLMEICAMQKRQFAFVHYGNRITVDQYLNTRDVRPGQILQTIARFENGGTPSGAALAEAQAFIHKNASAWKGEPDIVHLTDGAPNDHTETRTELHRAWSGGIDVHLVQIGASEHSECFAETLYKTVFRQHGGNPSEADAESMFSELLKKQA